jgi:hypothetical protein
MRSYMICTLLQVLFIKVIKSGRMKWEITREIKNTFMISDVNSE